MLFVPAGRMSSPETDDSAAAAQRRRIAEMLRKGEDVVVSRNGTLHERGQVPAGEEIVDGEVELVVPAGKLA